MQFRLNLEVIFILKKNNPFTFLNRRRVKQTHFIVIVAQDVTRIRNGAPIKVSPQTHHVLFTSLKTVRRKGRRLCVKPLAEVSLAI